MGINELVKKYEKNRDHYLSSGYNEAQVRADFLDPFFELLGWDINNTQGKLTNEREVLLEEPLKADASENTKKPDYTFRLFSERKFFLEAKKPSVKIESDVASAKQVRRYGFTAKLKISVLSNFEHLVIYDCSEKVETDDSPVKARINIFHYSEYESRFEEIKECLGKECIYSGRFDTVWEHIEAQLKLFSVDRLFLNQINEWRQILGAEVYKNNNKLNAVVLNDIVQSYINSIIFLRVCEDRDLEDYKTLLKFSTNDDFESLLSKFQEADRKYNSGLFNLELADEIIRNNSSSFWTIINQLYFPESTYSFSVFASDILGNIYEIFLGQQLAIINGNIVLENKPEHIDRDIVTTPTFVIQDLLRHSVQLHCSGKTDVEILSSTYADIACGSGAFLLETYQFLNDCLIDFYLLHSPGKLIQTNVSTYKLPYEIKRQIIENCIYGVDKDYNAVEACKFGLLLKLLEGENNSSIPRPALPDLSGNIEYGNTLIGQAQVSATATADVVNPYDFNDRKFDVIVGNPPYMATEHMKQLTPLELPLYKKNYSSAYKQFDKYYLFIEKAYSLLKDGGYLGYIVPSKFSKVGAGKGLRSLLREKKCVQRIVSFGANQIFQDKTTYTCLLVLQNEEQQNLRYMEIINLTQWRARAITDDEFDDVNFEALKDDGWLLIPRLLKDAYSKINKQSISVEELLGSESIFNGIQTSANRIYIHSVVDEDSEYYYFLKDNKTWQVEKELTRPYFKTSKGLDNLNTYRPLKPNSIVIYPYRKIDNGIEFVGLTELKRSYPYLYVYLLAYKDDLDNDKRDIKPTPENDDEWYRFGRHQSLDKCDVPEKLVVGVLSQGNKYAIDNKGTLISSGGTAGYCIITLPDDCDYSVYYIQALLNSKYLEWYSSLIGEVFRGGYIARGTKVLKRLPIRTIDFDDDADNRLHDSIVEIQKQLIDTQSIIDANFGNSRKLTVPTRRFAILKAELDALLTQLYGLEDDFLIPVISEVYAAN